MKTRAARATKLGPTEGGSQPRILSIGVPGPEVFNWDDDLPAGTNFVPFGQRLAASGDVFRQPDYGSGLVLVSPEGKPRLISKGADLAPVIADRVPVLVWKKGEIKSNKISAAHLNTMVHAETFLRQFDTIDEVTGTSLFLPNWSLTQPGYNDGGGHRFFYVGGEPAIIPNREATERFLDAMDWASNADRTNAVAAALTVQLRNHWPGGKPVLVVTANKSHAGKGTVIQFATGEAVKTVISWQSTGWPVERAAVGALNHRPDTGVLVLDNARLDVRDRQIASQFVERLATDAEPFLFSTGTGTPCTRRNNFVLAITTNHGTICEDILNRSLPIHLVTEGDVAARKPGIGNPSHEYLPANKERIGTEIRGMIVRWIEAGRPLDEKVRHPFSEWAKAVGGILATNGFSDFLENYGVQRTAHDPLRQGLGMLGAARPGVWLEATEWAKVAVDLGLRKTVIPPADQENSVSQARGIGVVFKDHLAETFTVEGDSERRLLRLEKCRRRVQGKEAKIRYRFVDVSQG